MNVEEMYQQIILDHYREKHHSGLREGYDAEVTQVNPSCGDELLLRVHVDGDVITDVSYDAVGCSISQASTSVMTDLVIGKTIGEAQDLSLIHISEPTRLLSISYAVFCPRPVSYTHLTLPTSDLV